MPKAQKSDELESFGRKNPMLLSMYVLLILEVCFYVISANPVCSFFSHTLLLHTYILSPFTISPPPLSNHSLAARCTSHPLMSRALMLQLVQYLPF